MHCTGFKLFILPALALALACGGGGSSTTASSSGNTGDTALPVETAAEVTTTMMNLETLTGIDQVPNMVPAGDPGVYALTTPTPHACVSLVNTPPDGSGFSQTVSTYQCTGPQGATLTGTVTLRWNASEVDLVYSNFRLSKGSQAFVYNGARQIKWDAAHRIAQVTVNNLSAVFTDSANAANNRNWLYSAAYKLDASAQSAPKLSGTFAFTAGSETTTGTILESQAFTWGPGCCYPISGSGQLVQGRMKADLTWTSTCGNVSIKPFGTPVSTTKTLPECQW